MIHKDILDQYEPTIGIECHVQLKTATKLFSRANNDAREAAPNTTVSPLCFGLPGTLPVLNRQAVALALRAGVALNADIAKISSFDRKHYFYPDLPKGYQITQLERPIIGKGQVTVPLQDTPFTVRITRAHMEEDAGKLTHPDGADYSLVDLNRAGTPLIEIVSEPDMHSAQQAKAYAMELWLLMKSADVTEGNLYYGNMRFDINISVAKKGSTQLGTRAEIKNLNSFRSIERAVEYEIIRQIELLEKGEKIVQETRGWHDAKQRTFSQRSKEDAQDYRYFPDADLPPIEVANEEIERARAEVAPLLPGALREQLQAIGLRAELIETLLVTDALQSGYIATVLKVMQNHGSEAALFTANYLVNRLGGGVQQDAQQESATIDLPTSDQFAEVYTLYANKELSSNAADELLMLLIGTDAIPRKFAEEKKLLQQNDEAALIAIIQHVLALPVAAKAVQDIQNGDFKAIGFLVGQVMKESKGQANPALANELIRKQLRIK